MKILQKLKTFLMIKVYELAQEKNQLLQIKQQASFLLTVRRPEDLKLDIDN